MLVRSLFRYVLNETHDKLFVLVLIREVLYIVLRDCPVTKLLPRNGTGDCGIGVGVTIFVDVGYKSFFE